MSTKNISDKVLLEGVKKLEEVLKKTEEFKEVEIMEWNEEWSKVTKMKSVDNLLELKVKKGTLEKSILIPSEYQNTIYQYGNPSPPISQNEDEKKIFAMRKELLHFIKSEVKDKKYKTRADFADSSEPPKS